MLPWHGMFPASWTVFHTACCKSAFFPPELAFLGSSTPKRSRNFTFTVSMVSWNKVFHEARPLSPASARWYMDSDQQPCLKLSCALQGDCTVTNPNQPKVTNTSNLSLGRDPTGGNTNSREIQRGYAHFLATL
jgi:hypothetical protein